MAKASTQSRERLAAVKQALRALGFNKQVFSMARSYEVKRQTDDENLKEIHSKSILLDFWNEGVPFTELAASE